MLFCLTIPKNPQTNNNSKHRAHVWLLDPVSVVTGYGNSHFRVLRSDLNTQTRTTDRHIHIHLIRTQRPQPGVKWLSVTEVLSSKTSIQILQLYHEQSLKWYQLMATKLNLRNSFFIVQLSLRFAVWIVYVYYQWRKSFLNAWEFLFFHALQTVVFNSNFYTCWFFCKIT